MLTRRRPSSTENSATSPILHITADFTEKVLCGAPHNTFHDFEGFHGLRLAEYESMETDIANLIAEHGQLGAELISHCDSPDAAREALDDNYQGSFDSPAAWAEQLLDDSGDLAQIPERLRGYFDFESYARDAELSGDIFVIEVDFQHHVFWSR
jgi:antirestriction protein